jgi:hypothetical protein
MFPAVSGITRRVSGGNLLPLFCLSLLVCPTQTLVYAQSATSGTVSGQITDPQGAAIPGAEVRLSSDATKAVKSLTTTDTGRYNFFNVEPGLYDLTISKDGFNQAKFPKQTVQVGLVLTLNSTLQLGSTGTVVEVSASVGAELQTTNSTIGSTISGAALDSLPNIGRDANAFITLQPGVAPGGQVAGSIGDQNQFMLDGGNNSSGMDGNNAVYTVSSGSVTGTTGGTPSGVMPTPIESIEEFKVGTANQTADFSGAAGGQVQMVTKRGTSQFHGSGYDFLLSSYFSANFWKNTHTPSGNLTYTPLPKTHQNRFGAALGGPVLNKTFLGGRTFFFFNYEGRRFPQSQSYERTVPSALLRLGVIQLNDASGATQAYNLNSAPVTYNGVTYRPATCPAGSCDPRNLGLNPVVKNIWATMPQANDPQFGDTLNTQGFLTSLATPQLSDQYTGRIDHDFGQSWHLMMSYRYFTFNELTTNQVNISTALSAAQSTAPRVQKPSFFVAGLSTTISPTITNDFRVSYLRNYWQWFSDAAAPQLPGLGAAVEIGGESGTNQSGLQALVPYNINAQNVRLRLWDEHDTMLSDSVNWVKGNHLINIGGMYQRNVDFHRRDDTGTTIFNQPVYQVGGALGGLSTAAWSQFTPAGATNQAANWQQFYTYVTGIVTQPQVIYTRSGTNMALQPLGTDVDAHVHIPFFNLYFSDTWKATRSLTVTYGVGYQVETPPTEETGKQIVLVDAAGNPVGAKGYLDAKAQAALAGQVYNPVLGYASIGNVTGKPKYLYDPFYGGLSPRISVAWNPNFSGGLPEKVFGHNQTVVRGGYSRVYGRLNGVSQVLNPLLGAGYLQAVTCVGATKSGQCLGTGGADPNTAFRIGTDGNVAPLPPAVANLSQPYYPGSAFGNAPAADATSLDRNYKPNVSDVFTMDVQRQIGQKLILDVGYIGRKIKDEFQLINIDAVPTMTTLGGQTFANAFGQLYGQVSSGSAVTAQPFFETALGGPGGAYCAGFANCTAAVASKQSTAIKGTQVYNLWAALNNAPGWALGRTLPSTTPAQTANVFLTTSLGYANYNAGFVSATLRDWHGMTLRSNLTLSHTLGTVGLTQSSSSTTPLNPFDLRSMYGPQGFDIRAVYNATMIYTPKIFRGNQWYDKVLGGWNIAPLFTAQSGVPLAISVGSPANCQSFGESNCSGDSSYENAVALSPYTSGNSLHQNVSSSTSVAASGNPAKSGSGLNLFADPNAVFGQFRRLVLGVDTSGGGTGRLRGMPTWNLDMAVSKDFRYNERMGVTFNAQFSNMMNHFQASNPSLNIDSPSTFGVITGQANTPRQIEFGLRVHF